MKNRFDFVFIFQILSRCPACLQNFLALFCHSTCDPFQSNFMAVDKADIVNDCLQAVYYGVSQDFAYGMFNSCKDVQNPSSGQKALDMLCGREASKCTPQDWLNYMGDKSKNPMAPFTIYFTISPNDTIHLDKLNVTLTPMHNDIAPCNSSCSCQDCRSSCKPLPPDIPPQKWSILGFDPVIFIVSCVYCAFVIVFGSVHIWIYFYCPPADKSWPLNDGTTAAKDDDCAYMRDVAPGRYDRFQVRTEEFFEHNFRIWGHFCARHLVVVPCTCVVICVALAAGLFFFQVTSNPVELWSAPDSQARQEKNYFDNNFRCEAKVF